MTLEQAIETVRIALGDRDEHHPLCHSKADPRRPDGACDCYAKNRQVPHKAMDKIEAALLRQALGGE